MLEKQIKSSPELINFIEELKEDRAPHTILFVSEDSLLSNLMMERFAQAILCPSLCDTCSNCVKLLTKNHPDVLYFPTKNQLLVEDSNKITSESFVKPIFADKKIFIINDFDKSTEEAQNKLLKVFEEPNRNVFYLLSTTNVENVLPTIRSRCFKIPLKQLNKEDIAKEIFASCDKPLVLELGKGNLGKSIDLSRKKDLTDIFSLAKAILFDMKNSKQVVIYANKVLAKKESFDLICEMLSLLLEDVLAKLCKKDNLISLKTQEEYLSQVSKDYSIKSICEIEKLIRKTQEERVYNVNLTTIVDNLLLGILEVKYLCK